MATSPCRSTPSRNGCAHAWQYELAHSEKMAFVLDTGQILEMVKPLRHMPGHDAPGLAITHAHANKVMARQALADGVIEAGKGEYKAGRSR